MIKTFSFRIKDSTSGKPLTAHARAVNWVWNYCNETQLHAVKWNKKFPSGFDLNKLAGGCSKELKLHSQSIQAVCEEYGTRRKQTGKSRLRWRGKRSLGWIPFKVSGIKLQDDTVTYQGRCYRFWKSRDIQGTIKTGNFSQDARGRWYVNFVCEILEMQPTEGCGQIGIDLGLKTFASCSNGVVIEAETNYRQLEDALADAQRSGHKKRVQNVHAKIKNRRKDHHHKVSTQLIRENELIVVGDVKAAKLAKTKMAKSVLDAGWSQFRGFLEYKAIAHQVAYIEVNENYTTRSCSVCGSLSGPRGTEGLGIREWVCSDCGALHDRDQNSALNILRLGHEVLRAEGP